MTTSEIDYVVEDDGIVIFRGGQAEAVRAWVRRRKCYRPEFADLVTLREARLISPESVQRWATSLGVEP